MGKVIVLGSLITDLVARTARFPLPGETLLSKEFGTFLGGKGINQAISAARTSPDVAMIGKVGKDSFGDAFFPVLEQEHINSEFVFRDPQEKTGIAMIIISEEAGQNMIVPNPQANLTITAQEVEDAIAYLQTDLQTPPIFLSQCETSLISIETALRLAHNLGWKTIWNVAPIPVQPLPETVFQYTDILIVNETEAFVLTDIRITTITEAEQAAIKLRERGSREIIITLGAQGSLWTNQQGQHTYIPAYRVDAIDPTAAGDAFCGVLAAMLARGEEMLLALKHASAAGALAAQRRGAIASLPTTEELQQFLQQLDGSTL
jgi:ribokinase